MDAELLVKVSRGTLTENKHYGHIVVTNNKGDIIFSRGDVNYLTYFRSAAKPIQALEVILSGAANHYNFNEAELAIMCASHYGEDIHRETVLNILQKLNLNKDTLQCGATTSLNNDYAISMALKGYGPDVLFNDCSGKHAGFLAVCKHQNYNLNNYIAQSHPLQKDIDNCIATLCLFPAKHIIHGIDGCGVPVHGMPLKNMAMGYANLARPHQLEVTTANACQQITSAMALYPEMLSGTGGFCTALTKATQGRLFGKIGAEAVYCVGNQDTGQGMAIKLEDGNLWRLSPIVMKTLTDLNWVNEKEILALKKFIEPENRNKHHDVVGKISAV